MVLGNQPLCVLPQHDSSLGARRIDPGARNRRERGRRFRDVALLILWTRVELFWRDALPPCLQRLGSESAVAQGIGRKDRRPAGYLAGSRNLRRVPPGCVWADFLIGIGSQSAD